MDGRTDNHERDIFIIRILRIKKGFQICLMRQGEEKEREEKNNKIRMRKKGGTKAKKE